MAIKEGKSLWSRTQVFNHDEDTSWFWWVIELSHLTESRGQSQRPRLISEQEPERRITGCHKAEQQKMTSEQYQCVCVCVCVCVSIGEHTCVILRRRCLWQLSALFEQQSQSAATAAERVAVTALVGDSVPSLPRSPPCTLCSSAPFPAPAPSAPPWPPLLRLLPASSVLPLPLRFPSAKVADTASVPAQLRQDLEWFSALPAKLLQLQISFNPTSKSLFVEPWKQGVAASLVWPCAALLQ